MKKTVQTLIEAMDTLPKKKLMRTLVSAEQVSIPELARNAKMSVPTATKIVNELIEKHFLVELGKHDNGLGRVPMMYGLNPTCGYFLGVNPCLNPKSVIRKSFLSFSNDRH